MARRWVKIWVQESLTGTIRFDFTPAERGVWYELIVLGGYCRLEGLIGAGQDQPFPDEYIAGMLNVPIDLFQSTIKKCLTTGRIERNGSGYRIVNWDKYQSEYDRQKPYREARKEREAEENSVVVYTEGGELDEHKTIIYRQSLWKVRQILAGEIQALEANKKQYRSELRRLGIPEEPPHKGKVKR